MLAPLSDTWVPDCSIEGRYVNYDREACYDAYRRWYHEDPDVSEDDVMRHIKQFIVLRVRSRYYIYTKEEQEEMVQTALCWAWDHVRKRRLPVDREPKPVSCFHSWLIWIIRKSFSAIPALWKSGLEKFESNDLMDQFVRRVPTADMVELEIFMEDLPKALYRRCLYRASGRYKDPRLVGALRYVLNRFFKGEPIITAWLRENYQIRDHLVFVDYTRMIIRSELSRIAEEVDLVTPSERRNILREGLRRFETTEA